jgi:hypothetical protein
MITEQLAKIRGPIVPAEAYDEAVKARDAWRAAHPRKP